MNNDLIPDFILNRSNETDSSAMKNFGGSSINDPIPDFIQQRKENDSIQLASNKKDLEVKSQLGIDFDNSFSSNQEAVKAYIDALSDEDYEIRDQRREEGYSLDARKALMDYKDLLNPTEAGGSKYKINATGLEGWALNYIKNLNEGYENLHPWTEATEDWLDNASIWLEEKMGKENMMNRWIDKNDPYNKMNKNEFLANNTISEYETWANIVQMPKVLLQTILGVASRGVDVIDNINNITTASLAEGANLIYDKLGKEKPFDIQYGENRSNLIGSYIQTVADGLGIGFVVAYPVATYFFSLLGAQNEDIANLENLVFSEKPGEAIDRLLSRQPVEDLIGIAGLNAEDQESLREALTDGLVLTLAAIIHAGGKKLTNAEITKLHKEALKKADQYSRDYAKKQMQTNYNLKDVAGTLPEGTEIYNQKGKRIATSTKEGGEFTKEGARDTLKEGAKGYSKSFREYMSWFYRNYKNRLTERDPNMPVGELPDLKEVSAGTQANSAVPEKEVKEKQEVYTEEKPVVEKGTKVKTVEKGSSIGEFIKNNVNKITGKKGGLSEELVTKLQNSKELQNEYINTIDPYLRENGVNNPKGVIEAPLDNLIDTLKDKIIARRFNNQIFRKGQKKYRSEIPESEIQQREKEDKDLIELNRILNKNNKDAESFLNYLLNLPEEKVQGFNKLIPEFTQHLNLIKDTLEITKAITKPDLVDKFLSFKSTRGTRRRHFIRRYLWKQLKQAYEKAGIKYNMYEIEKMLNEMSEEELVELESSMGTEKDLPNFIKQDFLDQIQYSLDREKRIKSENSKLPVRGTGPKTTWETLVKQGYKNPKTNKPFKTREEMENYVLPNGKTIVQFLTDANYKLKHTYNMNESVAGATDLIERTMEYYGDIDKLPEYLLHHEIGHIFLGSLTTAEYLDLIEGFTKATKSLKKYDPGLNISEYKSLAKSEVGATEFMADSIGLFLYYMDINGMGDYLQPYLSPKLGDKVKKILNGIGKDLRDEFSSVEVNGKKFTPSEEIKKLSERGLNDEEFIKRQHNDLDKAYNEGIGYRNRLADWKNIDPNIDLYKWDLDLKSDNFGKMIIQLKDGRKLTREEYKDTLTPELREKLYEDREIKNIEDLYYMDEHRKNIIKGDKQLEEFRSSNDGLSKYKEYLRDIDPDIVGLTEKDGKLYVRLRMESYWERYEMADRPGMVEVHDIPANEFFTKEDFKNLPKDLQKLIKKNAN